MHFNSDLPQQPPLTWQAKHVGILSEDGRRLTWEIQAMIENQSGQSFSNAPARLMPMDTLSGKGNSFAEWPVAITLESNGTTYYTVDTAEESSIEHTYVYDGMRLDRFPRNRRTDWAFGTSYSPQVFHFLRLQNPFSTSIPEGNFQLWQLQKNGRLDWIGNTHLSSLEPKEVTDLRLGPAVGLSGERIRTGYGGESDTVEESFQVQVQNQTDTTKTVIVIEHLARTDNARIITSDTPYVESTPPGTIRFRLTLRPDSTQACRYTVRYQWPPPPAESASVESGESGKEE